MQGSPEKILHVPRLSDRSKSAELGLDAERNAFEKSLMMTLPLLGGSIPRMVFGVMTDRLGARRASLTSMVLSALTKW